MVDNDTNNNDPLVVTNNDGSTSITETLSDGSQVVTTTNKDGSKVIVTTKTDGSVYTTSISNDGNTVTTDETVAPTNTTNTNTNTISASTSNSVDSEDDKTAVQKIKGTDTYAPDDIIPQYVNVEIDGFQFVAEELTPSESFSRRNLIRTSIMGGGEHTSQGEYVPRSFSFNTSLEYPKGKPDEYDKLWAYMVNKKCKVVSPYFGDMVADVQIQKTYPKGYGNTVKLSVTVKEISQTDNSYTVKTDMGDFTTTTLNDSSTIKEMENEAGDVVTVQTNVSSKHTSDMSKNLKEIKKESTTSVDVSDKNTKVQADSTKTNNNSIGSGVTVNTNNNSIIYDKTRDVNIKL